MHEGVCVHYNTIGMRDTCDAGVSYLDVLRPMSDGERARAVEHLKPGEAPYPLYAMFQRCPCHAKNGVDTCPKRRFPTQEEVRVGVEAGKRAAARVLAALVAIEEDGRERGTIPCPADGCAGTLHFTTGPLRMRCTAEGCIAAME